MDTAALMLFLTYMLTGFVWRTWMQWRRTGDGGFRGISGRPGSREWIAGVSFVVAMLTGLLGPIAALAGLDPIPAFDHATVARAGAALAVLGIAATLFTQGQMGQSWRIGVDEAERTDLVTAGVFGMVRNPIFTAMSLTGLGLALMTPNLLALAGLVTLILALQLQVRVVEEPYLVTTQGQPYLTYAQQVGRFFPGLGRLRRATSASSDT